MVMKKVILMAMVIGSALSAFATGTGDVGSVGQSRIVSSKISCKSIHAAFLKNLNNVEYFQKIDALAGQLSEEMNHISKKEFAKDIRSQFEAKNIKNTDCIMTGNSSRIMGVTGQDYTLLQGSQTYILPLSYSYARHGQVTVSELLYSTVNFDDTSGKISYDFSFNK
jgi:hypothetical protein